MASIIRQTLGLKSVHALLGWAGYNGRIFISHWNSVVQKNRLVWASRRGMLELDLVLIPFLENVYEGLPQDDKERYWRLLDEQDQDLFAWFMRRENPDDADLLKIVEIIRANTGMQRT